MSIVDIVSIVVGLFTALVAGVILNRNAKKHEREVKNIERRMKLI